MRRHSSGTAPAALVLLAAAFAFRAFAQGSGDFTYSTNTRLVVLPVTVLDKNGHLVTDLTQGQFQVFDNNQPEALKVFKREDVPVSMGIIIDSSGSMRDKRAKVQSAAITLVKDSNKEDEVFIVNFNDEAFLDMDFTSDIKKMEQGLSKIDSRGGTAMRDALRMSIDHLKEKGKRDKRVLLVVTDGDDNASMVSLENLTREAQSSDVLIYAIGLLSEDEKREAKRAKRALVTLTEATGGMAFFPKEVSDVEQIAHEVAKDIRNQYTLGYTPPGSDGAYHTVKVTVNAPGKLNVRTRLGYYATPEGMSTPHGPTSATK
ncbi:VWA domain-containing protein [Nevskia soli]|uniref:VWA domain-containing protein n=1 Tax=Nevskia soli TaxID=418856 RepID=UPI0015D83CF3|nr:VWA domain-containing protein [Nevskia soli]